MKLKYIFLALVVFLAAACKKEVPVKDVDFGVVAESVSIAPGESVTFNFTGSPENIVFYSGENLKDYAFSYPNERPTTGPDRPVVLKGFANPMPKSYTYKYAAAGTYTATFVASNISIDETKELVKQIEITVKAP